MNLVKTMIATLAEHLLEVMNYTAEEQSEILSAIDPRVDAKLLLRVLSSPIVVGKLAEMGVMDPEAIRVVRPMVSELTKLSLSLAKTKAKFDTLSEFFLKYANNIEGLVASIDIERSEIHQV